MGYRGRQFDMAHAFTPHGRFRDFHAAAVTDHTFIANLFIFSAVAFPVLGRTENPLAE